MRIKGICRAPKYFRIVFLAALFFLALTVVFSLSSSCKPETKKYGKQQNPCSCFVLKKEGFSVGYDGRLKQASWVFEELTKEHLEGESDRGQYRFVEDCNLPETVRSLLSDYKYGEYDRGHLAPAANHVFNDKGMADTFLLSNISPQSPSFNRGYWLKLEKHVRRLVEEHGRIKVVTGPLFLPEQLNNGKRYVKYEVIGESDIAVPTHFFKAVWTPLAVEAYILPNKKISSETPLNRFKTTIKKIEKVSGVVFSQIRKRYRP